MTTLLIFLIIIGFPLCFGAIWCAVTWLISFLCGWRRLAKQYRTEQTPTGEPLRNYWLMLGPASYRGVTTLRPIPEGLWILVMVLFRLGHPPLLILWHDIKQGGVGRSGLFRRVSIELGNPRITTLRLPSSDEVQAMVTKFLPTSVA